MLSLIKIILCLCWGVAVAGSAPPGFEDLPTEENAVVDIYYFKNKLGSFEAKFDDDFFLLVNPDSLLAALDFVKISPQIKAKLKKSFHPNQEKLCSNKPQYQCQAPDTKDISFVLDRSNYRAYIYINPELIIPDELPELAYYEFTKSNLNAALVLDNNLSANYKKEDGFLLTGDSSINITSTFGPYDFTAKITSSFDHNKIFLDGLSPVQMQLNSFHFSYETNHLDTDLGVVTNKGTFLMGEKTLLGVRIKNHKKLQVNSASVFGKPIKVIIDAPSEVIVSNQDGFITSEFFGPGVHYIDSQAMPEGIYKANIDIIASSGKKTSLIKPYVKKTDFPAFGMPSYEATIGYTINSIKGITNLELEQELTCACNIEQRVFDSVFLSLNFIGNMSYQQYNSILFYVDKTNQVSLAYGLASDGDSGFMASYHKTIGKAISSHINLEILNGDDNTHSINDGLAERKYALSGGTTFTAKRFDLELEYSYDRINEETLGASVNIPLSFEGIYGTFSFGVEKNKDTVLLNLAVQLSGGETYPSFSIERNSSLDDDAVNLNISSSYTKKFKDTSLNLSFDLSNQGEFNFSSSYNLANDDTVSFAWSEGTSSSSRSYNVRYDTSNSFGVIWVYGAGISAFESMGDNTGIMFNVKGSMPNDTFTFSTNNVDKITIQEGVPGYLPIDAFVKQQVIATANSNDRFYKINNIPEDIILKENHSLAITAVVEPVILIFGTIVDKLGKVMADARIYDNKTKFVGYTDITGVFEMQAKLQKYFVKTKTQSCYIDLSEYAAQDGMLFLDTIKCT